MAFDPDEFDYEAYLPLCRWDHVLRDRLGFKPDGDEDERYPLLALPIKPRVTLHATGVPCNASDTRCYIRLMYHGHVAHPITLGGVDLHTENVLRGIRVLLPVCRRVRPKYRPNMAQDQIQRALKGIAYD